MAIETLMQEAEGTSEEILEKVVSYLKFLKYEAKNENTSNPGKKKRRPYGIYHGTIKMSDDFNAPLNDFKEYM